MTRQEFSEQLVSLRISKGIGKNEITRLCEWTFLTTDRIEKASNNYSLSNAFKYINALNAYVLVMYPDAGCVERISSVEDWSKVIFGTMMKTNRSGYDIERITGVKQATLSSLKNGKQSWHIDRALIVMDVLGIRIEIRYDK